jgi:hypothetical protein
MQGKQGARWQAGLDGQLQATKATISASAAMCMVGQQPSGCSRLSFGAPLLSSLFSALLSPGTNSGIGNSDSGIDTERHQRRQRLSHSHSRLQAADW